MNAVDWAAALADIEARIAKLQGVANGIREMLAASGPLSQATDQPLTLDAVDPVPGVVAPRSTRD